MSSCPTAPAAPAGYSVFRGDVPQPVTQWAVDLLKHVRDFPYGQTWSLPYSGQTLIARKDPHGWTWRNGVLVYGCFQGITIYAPTGTKLGTGAVANGDLSTPDTTAAVYTLDETTDWKLVAISATALIATCVAFALALRHAGHAARYH